MLSKAFLFLSIMETEELKFTVELSEKDYLNYQIDHNQGFKAKYWIFYIAIVFIIISGSLIPSILVGDFSVSQITGMLPIFIPLLLVSVIFYSLRMRAKHSFNSDPFAHHPYNITITDKEIITNGYNGNVNCSWADIYRFDKTKNAVYIYVSDLKAIIIPLRYFRDDSELTNLISLLKQRINPYLYNSLKRKTRVARIVTYSIIILIVLITVFNIFNSNTDDRQMKAADFETNGEYQKAKSIYSELISEYPQTGFYYVSRAYCELKLNEFNQAQIDCEKAINIIPKSGEAYYYYAYALYNDGRLNEACEAMNKSKELGFEGDSEGFCEDSKDTLK